MMDAKSVGAAANDEEMKEEEEEEEDAMSVVKYPNLPVDPSETDWKYVMRRSMQQILPNLFLGPYASASKSKLPEMLSAGLTHVICVRMNLESNIIKPQHPFHFKYLVLELADSVIENIIPHVRTSNAFIDEAIESGGKVLVHGNGGISRSAALVIAYVMSKHGLTLGDAFRHVQSSRFCINPNDGFMNQLSEFEVIYRAMHSTSTTTTREKRPREEYEEEVLAEDSKAKSKFFSNIANCDNDEEIDVD